MEAKGGHQDPESAGSLADWRVYSFCEYSHYLDGFHQVERSLGRRSSLDPGISLLALLVQVQILTLRTRIAPFLLFVLRLQEVISTKHNEKRRESRLQRLVLDLQSRSRRGRLAGSYDAFAQYCCRNKQVRAKERRHLLSELKSVFNALKRVIRRVRLLRARTERHTQRHTHELSAKLFGEFARVALRRSLRALSSLVRQMTQVLTLLALRVQKYKY